MKHIIFSLILSALAQTSFAQDFQCAAPAEVAAAKLAGDDVFEFSGTHTLSVAEKSEDGSNEYFQFDDGIGGFIGVAMEVVISSCQAKRVFRGQIEHPLPVK